MKRDSSGLAGLAPLGCLLGCLLASACAPGHPARLTGAELAGAGGWVVVAGVPEVRQASREGCGAAALEMVLGFWRVPTGQDQLWSAAAPPPGQGVRAGRLRDLARDRGLQAFLLEGTLADLDRELARQHPVLVGVLQRRGDRADPHYLVVVGLNQRRQQVLVLDPAAGLRELPLAEFVVAWAATRRVTLVVYPPPV